MSQQSVKIYERKTNASQYKEKDQFGTAPKKRGKQINESRGLQAWPKTSSW
jgi:hypothetical protein